ncbi:hypothetical protein SAMN04488134_103124 [Amphibacillus marinus]|uniref:Uncharacterized protein n=1 Tax=Amphibacillus marinus TaxID=872970 RepID=A0A1H8L9X7_9BACI|nr:STM3941 family protein [Amphibacillus marinus]SEO01518.1 hypothetical protein SAMN04488134_103124 [Amphibacillus marinus]
MAQQDKIIEKSKTAYFILLVLSLFMLATSIFVVWYVLASEGVIISYNLAVEQNGRYLIAFIGLIAILWFSLTTFSLAKMTFSNRPLVIIKHDHLINYSVGIIAGKEIPFVNIKKVYTKSYGINLYICIQLKNEEDYLRQLSLIGRWMARMNKKMGFEVCLIHLKNAAEKVDRNEIVNDLKQRIQAY